MVFGFEPSMGLCMSVRKTERAGIIVEAGCQIAPGASLGSIGNIEGPRANIPTGGICFFGEYNGSGHIAMTTSNSINVKAGWDRVTLPSQCNFKPVLRDFFIFQAP
jgi:hypothetical protein